MAPQGTTLADPVTEEHRPDLKSSSHEITEYFAEQGAYDLFDYLLKELVTKQPADPLQHMIDCLGTPYPTGPLKVMVCSPPCSGRSALSKKLAQHFGVEYIGAGELLKEHGVATDKLGYAENELVTKLVMQRLQDATASMKGWILDGFPRTRVQTSFLREHSVVPTHVLLWKLDTERIRQRRKLIEEGEIEGVLVSPEVLETKLSLNACHSSSTLEIYQDMITSIKVSDDMEETFKTMESAVRMLPRSRGPQPPPRVVLLGPRGVGSREHANRLAQRLGAVFVDGQEIMEVAKSTEKKDRPAKATSENSKAIERSSLSRPSTMTSMDLPAQALESQITDDHLGAVGVRLRQPDCQKQGWVISGFPRTFEAATTLGEDSELTPTRVVVLTASLETCVSRLRHLFIDSVTGKIWTSLPADEHIRKRLQRSTKDQPSAVTADYEEYIKNVGAISEALCSPERCAHIPADGPPQDLHKAITEFVERPIGRPEKKA
mmetsp:Transcript_87080/g.186687  ORF Transcript_87080/g.186687 Transcript_87080/m.186687 type:complete len:491 (+) Transcript_87080:82-1554(+)